MGFGAFVKRLLGASAASRASGEVRSADPVPYQGYTIVAAPRPQNGQLLTAGTIHKTFPEGDKAQAFVRADTHTDWESACRHAVVKGKQIIDERGDRLFDDPI